jgi:hypothetical protein
LAERSRRALELPLRELEDVLYDDAGMRALRGDAVDLPDFDLGFAAISVPLAGQGNRRVAIGVPEHLEALALGKRLQ